MAFGSKQDQIESLRAERDDLQANLDETTEEVISLRDERERLLKRLEVAHNAGEIATRIETRIHEIYHRPTIIEAATLMAEQEVEAEETARVTRGITDKIKKDKYEIFAARFRTEKGAQLREELTLQMEEDGTLAQVEEEAKDSVRAEIYGSLVQEKKDATVAEASSPENRSKFVEKMTGQVEVSQEMVEFRRTTQTELEFSWMVEVEAEVKQEIEKEERAREIDFKNQYRDEYKDSKTGQKLRADLRKTLEAEWRDRTMEDVAKAMGDEELTALLGQKAEQARQDLAKEDKAKELLEEFETKGLDTSKINKGSRVVIYLGHMGKETVNERQTDRAGYTRNVNIEKDEIVYFRKLTLTAGGEGKFLVNADSLLDEANLYQRTTGLSPGTVIRIGRKVVDIDDRQEKLEPFLAADVPLYYDDDATDGKIVNAQYPVADVQIDKVWARRADIAKHE